MKKSNQLVRALLLFITMQVQAQWCPVPEPLDKAEAVGIWEGSFLKDGKAQALVVKIDKKGEGLSAKMALAPSPLKNADTELCPRGDLHLKITHGGREYEFRGRPNTGKMRGSLLSKNEDNIVIEERIILTKK